MKHKPGIPVLMLLALAALEARAADEVPEAAIRCEKAVTETVFRIRGRGVQDVEYLDSRRSVRPGASGDTAVKGDGRYRLDGRWVPFAYTCAYNVDTETASGIVLRDPGGARSSGAAAAPPLDISRISPEACESAVAADLKRRYSRVGRITFGSETRQLRPAEGQAHMALMEGQGAFARAPGLYTQSMHYRCEIDTRTGRVLRVVTRD